MNRREALERAGLVLGYAISAPVWSAVMSGCNAKPQLTFKPIFLTEDQAGIVAEVAEIILPKTDTPGAQDVGVPTFIDQILKECYNKADQDKFFSGLKTFDETANKEYGDSFLSLDAPKRQEYVKKVHDAAIDVIKNGGENDWPFILSMKELTVVGFFTSEIGATQVLQYEAVPGAFHGCVPLAEIGKAWAT